MSWTQIQPPVAPNAKAEATVAVGGRNQDNLCLSMRADILPKSWRGGVMLSASLGEGEHRGRLRLGLDGLRAFRLGNAGRKATRLVLRLPLPDGLVGAPADWPKRAVAITGDGGDARIITLPDWAVPRPVAKPIAGPLMGDANKPPRR